MILERGNMWDVFGKTDLFLITTNPIRRKDGAVVMGRGIALEAKTKFPDLPYMFGEVLAGAERHQDVGDPLYPLNVGIIGVCDGQMLGWFMTKTHWRSPSDLAVIEKSVEQLIPWEYIPTYNDDVRRRIRIDLNFPGIGNGKLRREDVLPLLQKLPDNVHIWEKE